MNNLIRHVWPRVKHVEEVCVDMLCKFQLVLNINSAVRFHVYNIHVVDMSIVQDDIQCQSLHLHLCAYG